MPKATRKSATKSVPAPPPNPPAPPPAPAPPDVEAPAKKENQRQKESKRQKFNPSPTLFSEGEEDAIDCDNDAADTRDFQVQQVKQSERTPKNNANLKPDDGTGTGTHNNPVSESRLQFATNKDEAANREKSPAPGPSTRTHVKQVDEPLAPAPECHDPEVEAELIELRGKATELRKRAILCISKIFTDGGGGDGSNLTKQTSPSAIGPNRSMSISIPHVQKLLEFLGLSVRSSAFIHCNLKFSKPVIDQESIDEFNDILYHVLGALLLFKEAEPVHGTTTVTTQRLLNLLLKHDSEVFQHACFSLLNVVLNEVTENSLQMTVIVPSQLVHSGSEASEGYSIAVNNPDVCERGLANIFKILYPFWALGKFTSAELPVRILDALLKTWRSSNHFARCEILEGFPYRTMIRDVKNQLRLCEIVEEVLRHSLMYGLNPKARSFLKQVWEFEVTGNTKSVTILQLRASEILLQTIFSDLFTTTFQRDAKEFVIWLLDKLRKAYPSLQDAIMGRLRSESIEYTFIKNPLALCFLDNAVYLECRTFGQKAVDGQNYVGIGGSESINTIYIKGKEITNVSQTWKCILENCMHAFGQANFSSFTPHSSQIDEFCMNLATQLYVLARIASTVNGELLRDLLAEGHLKHLLSQRPTKVTYIAWKPDFMRLWLNVLAKSLQLTSENVMNEIICLSIETLSHLSSSNLPEAPGSSPPISTTDMTDIKQTLAFYLSSRWFSFQQFPDIKLGLFSEYKKWRRVSLMETEVLQKCVIGLGLKFFEDCEDMVIGLITDAMKRYTTCLGIVMGLLELISEFSKIIRKVDTSLIHGFLIVCAKQFHTVWNGNEELEILLAKAFTRLICLKMNRDSRQDCCVCDDDQQQTFQPDDFVGNAADTDLLYFVAPLFKSTSFRVRLQAIELLVRFRRHRLAINREVVNYFLPFLSDKSHTLRKKVAANLLVYLQPIGSEHIPDPCPLRDGLINCVLQKLRSTLANASISDYAKENTALVAVLGHFALCADSCLQSGIIKLLIELTIKSKSHRFPALYARVIQTAARTVEIEPSHLLGRHREMLSKEIVVQLFRNILPEQTKILNTDGDWNCIPSLESKEPEWVKMCSSALNRLLFLGDYIGRSLFMEHFASLILLQILPGIRSNRNKQLLLLSLANFAGLSDTELLVEYFPRYYPLIVLHPKAEIRDSMLNFVKGIETETSFIAKCCYQTLSNELLSRMIRNGEEVFQTFFIVLQWINGNTTKKYTKDEILHYISTRLLGFYVYMQNQLSATSVCLERKKEILDSFGQLLMDLTAEHLRASKFKLYMVLSSLPSLFVNPQFQECLVRVWFNFASRVDSQELPDMIVQILAAAKLQGSPELVDNLLVSLATHKSAFKLALPGLHFVKDAVFAQVKNMDSVSCFPNGKPLLDLLVKQIGHYNRYVRTFALTKLRNSLQRHDKNDGFDIQEMLSERSEMIPEAWNLIMELMQNFCGKTDKTNTNIVATECVGLIGAVDPYRIPPQQSQKRTDNTRPALDTSTPAFLAEVLERLGQLVQSAFRDSDFDIFAFTIQEILRVSEIKADPQNPTWNLLSHKVKAVIEPMFCSKYSLRREVEPDCSYPLFGSSRASNFHEWVYRFICNMTSLLEPNFASASTLKIFDLSKLITTKCADFACFILPHVVLLVALACEEGDLIQITQELNLVVKQWIPGVFMNERDFSKMDSMCLDSVMNTSVAESRKSIDATENLRYANAIFNVIDHVSEISTIMSSMSSTPPKTDLHVTSEGLANLKRVIVPKSVLSRAAFGTGSFHRALKYYEQSMSEETEPLNTALPYLQRIFVALGDTDSLAGIIAVKNTNMSDYESIIANLSFGRKEDAATDLVRLFNNEDDHPIPRLGLAQVYLTLDQPQTTRTFIDAYFKARPSDSLKERNTESLRQDALLHECKLEACWRLEQWDEVKETLKNSASTMPMSWSGTIAQALLNLKDCNFAKLTKTIDTARDRFIAPLAGLISDWDSYVGKYGDIVRLQILSEVQQAGEFLREVLASDSLGVSNFSDTLNERLEFLLLNWKRKLAMAQNAISVIDPIFSVRKGMLKIIRKKFEQQPQITNTIDLEIMSYLLKIAKLECKDQNYVRAQNCIIQASNISPMVFIHEAKLLIKKGNDSQGLEIINKGLENNKTPKVDQRNRLDPFKLQEKLYSKALLMYAQLNDKLRNVDVSENIRNYNRACDIYPTEKNFVNMASYFDRVLDDFQDRVKKPFDTQKLVLHFYVESLKHGCKHVFQSLPRLLSIWFDHASSTPPRKLIVQSPPDQPLLRAGRKVMRPPEEPDNPKYTEHMAGLKAMTEKIEDLVSSVPTYVLLTAFPQLVSRLYHPEEVWPVLKVILVKIAVTYPGKALWMLASVRKSSFKKRSQKCKEIITAVCKSNPNLTTLTTDHALLADHLIALSKYEVAGRAQKTSLKAIYPKLEEQLKKKNFSKILIPLEQFMTVTLPQGNSNIQTHEPYPEQEVYIVGVEDHVDIMSSLQRPKKIVFRGSNGKQYGMMVKAHDDLRKDSKVMEFNNVVNWYLSRTSEASKRNLHIRTYAVTPLNETYGLVEWVDNLTGYRSIISSSLKEIEGAVKGMRISKDLGCQLKANGPFEAKLSWFEEAVDRTPAVFANWFFRKYKNPQDWYKARLNYARTAAVMSVVGYIMGLGDRHGENILIDTLTGDVVHVDFNAIFNKGESFQWPERVPFRLTKNIIDGFGPLGVEGTFRKICELTLKILRDNIEVFMSTMQPFVFDPLVEWNLRGQEDGDTQLRNNDEALRYLNDIRLRLLGGKRNMTKQLNVEFSVEAQVNYLIQEASNKLNLCQMYPGWMPFL